MGAGELAQTTVLLTGASRGIGRATAVRLAEREARLVLTARGSPGLDDAAASCDAVAIEADLSRPAEVQRLAAAARRELRAAPDVLINNAGVFRLAPAARTDPDVFERHLAVNLAAPFRLVRAFLPEMLERDAGTLVHVGSVAGRQPFPGNVAYGASKYGLRGMHEVLAVELEGTGVRSVLVEPGPVDTGAWDPLASRLGDDLPARSEMLEPGRVADAVVSTLAAAEPSSTEIVVDGG